MALPVRQQAIYWGLTATGFLLALWILGDVILPFIVGGALAYCLDPMADALERLGLGRTTATVVISLLALLAIVTTVLVLVPLFVEQLLGMTRALPDFAGQIQAMLSERFPSLDDPASTLRRSLASVASLLESKGGELIQRVLTSALSVIQAAVFLVVVPVVTFYLLLDWDRLVAQIDRLVPRDYVDVIRRLAREVDDVLAAFIRGQLTVSLILGTFYAVALMAVGLNFGLAVGAIAGMLTFIPYVGSLVGGALSIGLALFQFWDQPIWIVVVAVIFVFGQTVEGNVLTPKLVGGSVGLHPVWLLFALSAFGTLFGFVGLLVAVPVAAILGVMARFFGDQYLDSRLYRGIIGRREGD